ncbi:nucleoside hydrolase [Ktedonobacter racemifer]|uniref:Inosine/uridine-preferring nucleoside hydrolase n=1 Tax=Ktedonobacter racemifer DSM 44963 TaxID=485913 RepID=D6TM77_KTERA|nr:nucleoside hydrolase [Ktedonobacter racemifer]EFH86877.1 Inosine/uridine-preferring nucleoside hydrolase [Ktedonobacter racemifer DSM 44963]
MHRIILDTDPGIDDALALFLALASPEIQLEALTTVCGNVNLDHTTRNALALLSLAGREDIPVAAGASRPLILPHGDAASVHGQNGLGQLQLPEPHIAPHPQHAADLIIERVMQAPGEITLVAIGPLTNLALALRKEPRIARAVREVYIMGGALRVPGNVTPAAEFNIYCDPHAAHVVFHAGWPLRIVSLDVTHQVSLTPEDFAQLATSLDGSVKHAILQMTDFYFNVFQAEIATKAFHMHDPLCLAATFRPDLITWQPAYVDVELQGALTLGETVADFKRHTQANIQAPVAVDAAGFRTLFLERIGQAYP